MDIPDLLASRLHNQFITNSPCNSPEDIVHWLGAIQAQDFTAAKWAIGLRSQNLSDTQIEDAFNQGKILRTHVMRPTWHFVTPKDIHWMLALTAPRIHAQSAHYYRQLELDDKTFVKSTEILVTSLTGGNYLTRAEIGDIFRKNGIQIMSPLQLTYMIGHAELDGIVCSGPRKGKQFTYALLDERAPKESELSFEESLADLAKRYFQSHGPATLHDFMWWSGLTSRDAKNGIELNKSVLHQETIANTAYWFTDTTTYKKESKMYLLPNYDEYIVGYKERGFIFDDKHITKLDARGNPLFQHTLILNGKLIGTWKRELKENSVALRTNIFETLGKTEKELLKHALDQFGRYTEKPISEENR